MNRHPYPAERSSGQYGHDGQYLEHDENAPRTDRSILSELRAFDASTLKNHFRNVAEQAAKGAVAISRYSRPELVLMTAAIHPPGEAPARSVRRVDWAVR